MAEQSLIERFDKFVMQRRDLGLDTRAKRIGDRLDGLRRLGAGVVVGQLRQVEKQAGVRFLVLFTQTTGKPRWLNP